MKKFTVRLLVTLGFAVLAAVVSSSFSKNTNAIPLTPVLVTNSGVTETGSAALSSPQSSPTLVGDGLTQVSNIAGQTFGLFNFTFNVTNLGGELSQHLSSQTLLLSSDLSNTTVGGINRITSSLTNVQCLETNKNPRASNEAWWSGTEFFFTPDPRINAATNAQILNDVNIGRYVVGGKIISGVPEKRSLFIAGANVPEVSLNDAGSINSVSVSMFGTSGASFCTLNDGMFAGNADFRQLSTIGGSTHCITGQLPSPGQVLCDIEWLD